MINVLSFTDCHLICCGFPTHKTLLFRKAVPTVGHSCKITAKLQLLHFMFLSQHGESLQFLKGMGRNSCPEAVKAKNLNLLVIIDLTNLSSAVAIIKNDLLRQQHPC